MEKPILEKQIVFLTVKFKINILALCVLKVLFHKSSRLLATILFILKSIIILGVALTFLSSAKDENSYISKNYIGCSL